MDRKIALYQKYRPISFKDVFGQKQNIEILKNSILKNKVQNGYIFCGDYGTGKTSLARIFAGAMNCTSFKENHDVGDECFACKAIVEGHPDLIEIDAASNSGIDAIRLLREETQIVPLEFTRKVYIIDEAHMLSTAAWDGMLKILEDPYLNVTFIFATTNVNKVPKTIISRCIKLNFYKLEIEKMIEWFERILKLENIPYKKNALKTILISANGSFRDVLTLLDKKILLSEKKELTEEIASEITGTPTLKLIRQWIKYLIEKDMENSLKYMNDFLKEEMNPIAIAELTIMFLSELVQKNLNTPSFLEYVELANTFYDFLKDKRIFFNPHISLKIKVISYLSKNYERKYDSYNKKHIPLEKSKEESVKMDVQKSDINISVDKVLQSIKNKAKHDPNGQNIDIDEEIDDIDEEIVIDVEELEKLNENTIELDIIDDEKKDVYKNNKKRVNIISEFLWEVIVEETKEIKTIFPKSWNLTTENFLAILYNSTSNQNKDFQKINTYFQKLDRLVIDDKYLPFSALLYDSDLVMLSNGIILICFNTPIRAALMNRISRTKVFLDFLKNYFGDEYWIIALSSLYWRNLKQEYSNYQQIKKDKLSLLEMPLTPPIINKLHKPTKKAHLKLIEKLKKDKLFFDFDIIED